jgi:hypothetical protein
MRGQNPILSEVGSFTDANLRKYEEWGMKNGECRKRKREKLRISRKVTLSVPGQEKSEKVLKKGA